MTRKPKRRSPAPSAPPQGEQGKLRRAHRKKAIRSTPSIDASARALGLKIEDAWRPAIRAHLQVTLRIGALVTSFALPDEAEPAPVFEP